MLKRALIITALLFGFVARTNAITIPTVPVGNVGNAGELTGISAGGFGVGATVGGVAYNYRIGTTEVTNSQYAEFLNAKAKTTALSLYSTSMGSDPRGGITRSGISGSFTYTAKTSMGDKPVNFVTWYDAVRFTNWLHNGQGNVSTETGAYTLLGGTTTPSNGLSVQRNSGALWFLPSEDEWYKAAYHQPATQGGDIDEYWFYPTASNSVPVVAAANAVGEISNPGINVATYAFGADWNGLDGNVTTVGTAGPMSQSYYGTSDQGGNVWEWTEALIDSSNRNIRGGSYGDVFPTNLQASFRERSDPRIAFVAFGFRVATVPEPSSFVLAAFGLISLVVWRWQKR